MIAGAAFVGTRSSSAAEHGEHAGNGAAAATKPEPHAGHSGDHAAFRGAVDNAANGFDPHKILREFDSGTTSRMASRAHRCAR